MELVCSLIEVKKLALCFGLRIKRGFDGVVVQDFRWRCVSALKMVDRGV